MAKEQEPKWPTSRFEFGEWEKALDAWTEADNKVNDLLEEWRRELEQVHESIAAGSVEEEAAVSELSHKYVPLLDAARKDADDAYNRFKEEQSRPLS